jgi:hypothetical protein
LVGFGGGRSPALPNRTRRCGAAKKRQVGALWPVLPLTQSAAGLVPRRTRPRWSTIGTNSFMNTARCTAMWVCVKGGTAPFSLSLSTLWPRVAHMVARPAHLPRSTWLTNSVTSLNSCLRLPLRSAPIRCLSSSEQSLAPEGTRPTSLLYPRTRYPMPPLCTRLHIVSLSNEGA